MNWRRPAVSSRVLTAPCTRRCSTVDNSVMPRLHHRNKLRATSCADEHVARNKLLVTSNKKHDARNLLRGRATCCGQQATCCAQQVACYPQQVACCAQLVASSNMLARNSQLMARNKQHDARNKARNLLRWCKRGIRRRYVKPCHSQYLLERNVL